MRGLLAAVDRWLDALANLAYGPIPRDEYPVGLGTKLAVSMLFAAMVVIGLAASW